MQMRVVSSFSSGLEVMLTRLEDEIETAVNTMQE